MRWGKLRIRGLTHSRFAYNLCLRRRLTACESTFETLRRRTREEDPLRLYREHLPALHSPAGRDVIPAKHAGRPAALIESGGGTGPVKPRQPARLIVMPRGRCQLLRRRLREMSRRI